MAIAKTPYFPDSFLEEEESSEDEDIDQIEDKKIEEVDLAIADRDGPDVRQFDGDGIDLGEGEVQLEKFG